MKIQRTAEFRGLRYVVSIQSSIKFLAFIVREQIDDEISNDDECGDEQRTGQLINNQYSYRVQYLLRYYIRMMRKGTIISW